MGGFTENPPPPAQDYPPENAFDVTMFANNVAKELRAQGAPSFSDEALHSAFDKSIADGIAFILRLVGDEWGTIVGIILRALLPMLQGLVSGMVEVLKPGVDVLGALTGEYVQIFTDEQRSTTPGKAGARPDISRPAAAGLFDSILAPLGFLVGGANPATVGAGETNSQFVLGSLVSIHLMTWMVDIIGNLTGAGALKFIHSFDNVITGSLGATVLRRQALKPYLTKFMADPLTRDLNLKMPLEISSPSTLLKSYLRGTLSQDQLNSKMRGKGFAEEITAQLLLDAASLLSLDEVKWLVDHELWTRDQAITHLKQKGYPDTLAPTVLEYLLGDLVRSNMLSLANSLVDLTIDHRMDNTTLRYLLKEAGFTQDEINAFATRAAILGEASRRPTYTQVRNLYQESLVDLDYVLRFLKEENYSDDDADLLVLLEFAKKDERAQAKAQLLERRRIALEAALGMKAQADAARAAELAALGGPTS